MSVVNKILNDVCRHAVDVYWEVLLKAPSNYRHITNDLYSSPNIVRLIKSRRMRWAGHVARMEEGRVVLKVLVGKPEGKRPLGRPRRRWEDNIKMDLQKVGRGLGTGWSWLRIGTGGGRL